MDNKYGELKKYIQLKVEKLNSIIEEHNNIIEKCNQIESLILKFESDIANIDANDISFINSVLNNDLTSTINKIKLISPFFDDDDLANEEQVLNYKEKYHSIISNLNNVLNSLRAKVYNHGRNHNISMQLANYEKYLTFFDETGIKKELEIEEFEVFINFIKDAPLNLDEEEKLALITEFSRYNLKYYIEMLERNSAISLAVVANNSEEVFEEINSVQLPSVETDIETNLVIDESIGLSEDEEVKLDKIKQLLNELKEKYVANGMSAGEFIDDEEFSLQSRIDFYDVALSKEEKWSLIMFDLENYLIPSLRSDYKDNIMKIFDYILELHEKDFAVVEVRLYDFSEEEKLVIENARQLLEDFRDEIKKYEELSESNKNYIDSIYQLILENNFENIDRISSSFSPVYVKFIKRLLKLKDDLFEFDDIITAEKEYRTENDEQEVDLTIKNLVSKIKSDSLEVKNLGEQAFSTDDFSEELGAQRDIDKVISGRNLFVFLPNSNSNRISYYDEDKNNVLRNEKSVMHSIETGFKILTSYNITNKTEKSDSFKRIVSTSFPKFVRNEIKPFRYRSNNSRIAFSLLPITKKNRETIRDKYSLDTDDINVVLVLGYGIEYGSQEIYGDILNRMVREHDKIKNIQNIFGNDFDNLSEHLAIQLIDEGFSCLEDIKRNVPRDGRD